MAVRRRGARARAPAGVGERVRPGVARRSETDEWQPLRSSTSGRSEWIQRPSPTAAAASSFPQRVVQHKRASEGGGFRGSPASGTRARPTLSTTTTGAATPDGRMAGAHPTLLHPPARSSSRPPNRLPPSSRPLTLTLPNPRCCTVCWARACPAPDPSLGLA
ncbi:unnamed protein product [Lampetra fluviatilis]